MEGLSEIENYRPLKTAVNLTIYAKLTDIKKKILSTPISETVIYLVPEQFNFENVDPEYHRYIFYHRELRFNILNNIMVPSCTKTDEFTHIKDKLPKIKSYDPIVRRMNFKPGDILKFEYPNSDPYYRVVSA